jgi:hypothetical protein
MKNACLTLFVVLSAFTPFAKADDTVVRWQTIVGVNTAPNVDNPVAGTSIQSGTLPWTALGGRARVNLTTGAITFDVEGLVLNGGDFNGTLPSGFPKVVGTLVCNAGGTDTPVILDTAAVSISAQGNADFSGQLTGIPAQCANPLFLIRVPAFGGRWIANGAVRMISGQSGN